MGIDAGLAFSPVATTELKFVGVFLYNLLFPLTWPYFEAVCKSDLCLSASLLFSLSLPGEVFLTSH